MATIIYCGYSGCEWEYKTKLAKEDKTNFLIFKLFFHYNEKHEIPLPLWDFYKE